MILVLCQQKFTNMEPAKQTQKDPLFLSWKNRCIDFMKAYQEQHVDNMLSHCAEDCLVEFIPLGDAGKGSAQETGKAIWSSLIDCFPTIDNTVHSSIKDNGSVRCEVTIWGKQEKDFAGLVSKGKTFEEEHIFIFKVNEDGLIQKISVDWNHESFVRQLT